MQRKNVAILRKVHPTTFELSDGGVHFVDPDSRRVVYDID